MVLNEWKRRKNRSDIKAKFLRKEIHQVMISKAISEGLCINSRRMPVSPIHSPILAFLLVYIES